MSGRLRNWAGNYEYTSTRIVYPETIDEISEQVKRSHSVRTIGTRHSFNGIADSPDTLISLGRCKPAVSFDHERKQVTFGANMTYGELCPILQKAGYALHNLASLPHISVIGACMTGTHGSGVANRSLSAALAAFSFVSASGEVVSLSRETHGEMFEGAVVSLGGLGVVFELTLDLVPAFEMSQHVYVDLPVKNLESHFDDVMSSAYSVSLFTDWNEEYVSQVWLKHRRGTDAFSARATDFFGAIAAAGPVHPIKQVSAEFCTTQLGLPGPWHERLPHFRMDATPSAGSELQSEYFVPRRQAVDALRAVRSLRQKMAPHLLVSEIRCIAADRFWLSPCNEQDSVGIHFTWKQDWDAVRSLLPQIEAQLEPYGARPHWGKLFTLTPARLRSMYGSLPRFRELLGQFDRQGKFRNAFLQTYLYS